MNRVLLLFGLAVSFVGADESLRMDALKYGLQPVPKDFQTLLRVLNEERERFTPEKIALGKRLFFEKRLSLNADISCATCHKLKEGGIDGQKAAVGYKERINPFHLNTPTVLNSALSSRLFWNGRSTTLEDQAKGPIIASFEMASSPTLIESRLNDRSDYVEAFSRVYGTHGVTFGNVVDAIGAYERTLITRGRFDDFLEGNVEALTTGEQAGLRLYLYKGCVGCHNGMGLGGRAMRKFPIMRHAIWGMSDLKTIGTLKKAYEGVLDEIEAKAPDFKTDAERYAYLVQRLDSDKVKLLAEGYFDTTAVPERYKRMTTKGCYGCHEKVSYRVDRKRLAVSAYPFENKGSFLGEGRSSRYFRVPLLRNIVSTKPYFHNGGIEKLEEAIKLMVRHQVRSKITDEEISNLVAFLKAVDGALVEYNAQ